MISKFTFKTLYLKFLIYSLNNHIYLLFVQKFQYKSKQNILLKEIGINTRVTCSMKPLNFHVPGG